MMKKILNKIEDNKSLYNTLKHYHIVVYKDRGNVINIMLRHQDNKTYELHYYKDSKSLTINFIENNKSCCIDIVDNNLILWVHNLNNNKVGIYTHVAKRKHQLYNNMYSLCQLIIEEV